MVLGRKNRYGRFEFEYDGKMYEYILYEPTLIGNPELSTLYTIKADYWEKGTPLGRAKTVYGEVEQDRIWASQEKLEGKMLEELTCQRNGKEQQH